jgi:hypothetical protein
MTRTIVLLVLLSLPSPAGAQKAVASGGTLKAARLTATLTLEINATDGAFAKPVSLAPDIAYGLTSNLTLTAVSSTFATTGFRGSAGDGLCVTGTTNGCLKPWNNFGVEGHYALTHGPVALAAMVGLHDVNIDLGWWAAKVGARVRASFGGVAVSFTPAVFVALTDRDATVSQKDTLWLPLLATVKLSPVTVGLSTGIKGALEKFGDNWTIPFGAMVAWSIDSHLTLGASWVFGKLGAAPAVATPKGLDQRAIQAWFTVTI